MLLGDLAIVRLAGHQGRGDLFKGFVEGLVVEEDPVIVVSAVESVLDLADRASNIPHVAVASQSNEGGVHARSRSRRNQFNIPIGIFWCHSKRGLRIVSVLFLRDGRSVIGALGFLEGLLRFISGVV